MSTVKNQRMLFCFIDQRVWKMGARQADGLYTRTRRAPQELDQSSTDFVLFQVVIFERVSFSPSFFPFLKSDISSL